MGLPASGRALEGVYRSGARRWRGRGSGSCAGRIGDQSSAALTYISCGPLRRCRSRRCATRGARARACCRARRSRGRAGRLRPCLFAAQRRLCAGARLLRIRGDGESHRGVGRFIGAVSDGLFRVGWRLRRCGVAPCSWRPRLLHVGDGLGREPEAACYARDRFTIVDGLTDRPHGLGGIRCRVSVRWIGRGCFSW